MGKAQFDSPWNVETMGALFDDAAAAKGDADSLTDKIAEMDAATAAKPSAADVSAVVKNGAKNKFYKQADRPATVEDNGVTLAWQPDGTITLTGTATAQTTFYLGLNYDGGVFTTGDILSGVPSGSTGLTLCIQLASSPYTKFANDTGNGAKIPASVVTGQTYRILLVVASGTNTSGKVIKPMICAPELWAMDPSYQQYAPTNRQLYEMILALQTGG